MPQSIDRERLDELGRQMGGGDALSRIVALYVGKLPGEMDELRSGLDAGDLEEVQTSAHRLKSSSGQLGAERLAALLADLEQAAREKDQESTVRIIQEVETEAAQVQKDLNDFTA